MWCLSVPSGSRSGAHSVSGSTSRPSVRATSKHRRHSTGPAPGFAAEMRLRGQRVATILLYLNDDYAGGETAFPELGIAHRGGRGDALLFFSADAAGVPDRRTVHAGLPPTTGSKWVLSQFIRSRPPGEIMP